MTLKEELFKGYSKPHTVYLANKIAPNQETFDELVELMLSPDMKISQRAAWIFSHCVEQRPWLIKKHLKLIINHLENPAHDAVKRNTLRVLQFIEIEEDEMGILADLCFKFLYSAKESIAIKAHSMTILYNIAKKYPELKNELKMAIQEQLPFGSAGIKNRGNKILRALEKISTPLKYSLTTFAIL